MSSHGDYEPEMTSHDPSEAETERLLNGAVQADSTGASELADARIGSEAPTGPRIHRR